MLLDLNEKNLKEKLEKSIPGAKAEFQDLTGTRDHWQVTVIADAFTGKSLIQQHRMVKEIFEAEINAGHLHALTMKTYSPEQWEKFGRK